MFYGCVKGTAHKWLDLKKLFENILQPENKIIQIKYFTARVNARKGDAEGQNNQQFYLHALENFIPEVEIHYGHFLSHKVRMAHANPPPQTVEVFKTEEKGSDVNLAVHLLNDAWKDIYDCAVVVSNDSDMAESMKLVKQSHPRKLIGLITPGEKTRTSEQLKRHADFTRKIRDSILAKSQLPSPIPNTNIHKPKTW